MFAGLFASCEDEIRFEAPGEIPEGWGTVTAEVGFMPLTDALTVENGSRATVAPPGNAMNEIMDLCILFYNKSGNLVQVFSEKDFIDYKLSDEPRTDGDAENGVTAESNTKRATLKFDAPFGEYYIYAVSNLGGVSGKSTLDILTENNDLIQTRDGLKKIQCKWDASNFRNNREMMGAFTDASAATESGESLARSSSRMVEETIRINRDNMMIHAWLKRVASKVTIEFDGSNLRDNITIYIQRATIHHIPAGAFLGAESKVADESGYIETSSHHLDYGLGSDYKQWPSLTRNRATITKVADGATLPSHSEDSYALYFYENRQGNFEGMPEYDKRQYPSIVETVKDKTDLYDRIPNGTYIEVEGYYQSTSGANPTQGPIKYRFMLGQDTRFDFNADRNCHYKVTMCFRGNGNDVDWHIDYDEENPQMFAPDLYYISYLYDRKMTMPVRINEGENYKLVDLRADIICNHWAPEDPYRSIRKQNPSADEYEFTWNVNYYNSSSRCDAPSPTHTYEGVKITDEFNAKTEPFDFNKDIEFGFLSLRRVRDIVIGDDTHDPQTIVNIWNDRKIGHRVYDIPGSDGVHSYGSEQDPEGVWTGQYNVEKNGIAYVFNLPFYTRARQLSTYLAYTANNPYGYPRKAVVRIIAKFQHKTTGAVIYRSKRVTIQQVERVQNPKGIYRSHDNDDPFDVRLMISDPENLDRFIEVISDGPWRAEVVGNNSTWVLLNNGTKPIYGESGTPIRFQVKPSGVIGSDRVRNAAVRIYYNNYTCVHLIILRQGYAPVQIPGSSTRWATFNMFKKGEFMKSPIATGSYFKFGNLDDAINESNNSTWRLGRDVGTAGDGYLDLAGGGRKRWSDIPNKNENNEAFYVISNRDGKGGLTSTSNIKLDTDYFGTVTVNGQKYRVASYEDYQSLRDDNHVETAYGVVYADGATETATTTAVAYRFLSPDNTKAEGPEGMRGIICYAWNTETNTGNFEQVFFPISGSGHGRRKQWLEEGDCRGVLRYSDVKYPLVPPRIQVFDLNQTPGAIYWIQKGKHGGHSEGSVTTASFAVDMNYYTYAFGTYHDYMFGISNARKGSDALLIKWVLAD